MAVTKAPETCNQLMDAGRCRGRFPSFYYDFARGECLPFDYTGCGGNSNRFHTKEQCESLCLRREPSIPIRIGLAGAGRVENVPHHPPIQQREQAQDKHVCEHPKDTGPCNRFVTKWFYNKGDGTCNRFHYGGCEGNPNRFETEQQCKQTCGEYTDTCYLPKVVGPCAGKNKRFFYNQSTKQCTEFEYSGC
uniref:BPTI/Kunitz inhibitor domain-containing protein n=1 Tax=Acrobeloides nanus TaxID=290746 RepID=A0A914D7A5_9BILA